MTLCKKKGFESKNMIVAIFCLLGSNTFIDVMKKSVQCIKYLTTMVTNYPQLYFYERLTP